MNLGIEMIDPIDSNSDIDESDPEVTREKIAQYISAGILFPHEIRVAERILSNLSKFYRSQENE